MEISEKARRLTEIEKKQYFNEGFVKSLPVFSKKGVIEVQNLFEDLSSYRLHLTNSPSVGNQ